MKYTKKRYESKKVVDVVGETILSIFPILNNL